MLTGVRTDQEMRRSPGVAIRRTQQKTSKDFRGTIKVGENLHVKLFFRRTAESHQLLR